MDEGYEVSLILLGVVIVLLFMSGLLSGSIVLLMIIDGRENKRIERHKNTLRNIAALEDDVMPDALTHWDEEATEAYRLELKKAKIADLNCQNCNSYIYDDGYCNNCGKESYSIPSYIPDSYGDVF
jgi:Na+-transporting NADH:ubiquinone oxidoreductase subunit NqrC